MRPSQDTDKRLIKAAKELLLEKGTLDISMREISKRAKVNMGMFYYNFKDKDDFFAHVFQEFYEEFFSALSLDSSHSDSPYENLKKAVLFIGNFAVTQRPLIAAIFMGAVNGDKTTKQFLKKNFARHVRFIIGLIKEAQKQNQILPLPPFTVLTMVMAGVNGPTFAYGSLSKNPFIAAKIRTLGASKESVLSSRAIEERVDILLKALKKS